MKKLLIVLAALMIPTMAVAGNVAPKLWLEVNYQADDPTDPEGPGYLVNPCVHPAPTSYPFTLPCFAPRIPYNFYVVPIHIGQLDRPICPTAGGSPCLNYGGYLGLGFGAALTGGTGITFMSWNACPGFLKGPSITGEPSSMLSSSTDLCHDWYDHEGYMLWLNGSGTTARYINIVASADLGHNKLINCANMYDEGTTIGGGVQIGGAQTIVCGDSPTAVNNTTWGAIKGLYR
jgi:hypothetical protein